MAANLEAWATRTERREDLEARQAALNDRVHSKEDRTSSAMDRYALTDKDDERQLDGPEDAR
jgi:hypothetical protein